MSTGAGGGKKNPYQVLGVSKGASAGEIKKAYFQLAKKYHPDSVKNASEAEKAAAKEKFVECQQAYEILSDDQKRSQFDQFGSFSDPSASGILISISHYLKYPII